MNEPLLVLNSDNGQTADEVPDTGFTWEPDRTLVDINVLLGFMQIIWGLILGDQT